MLHLEGVLHLPLIGQLQREKLIRGHWPVSLLELPLGQSLGAEWSKLKETRWKYAVWSGRRQWANTSGSGSATEAVLGLLFIRDKTPTIQSILNTRRLAYITRKYITSRSSNDFIRAPAPPPPLYFIVHLSNQLLFQCWPPSLLLQLAFLQGSGFATDCLRHTSSIAEVDANGG